MSQEVVMLKLWVCCGPGAGTDGKRHAKSCDKADRAPILVPKEKTR